MILDKHIGLFTDHYELTMAQGYFLNGKKDTPANFDYLFRTIPFEGGYVIFAGLRDMLHMLQNLTFGDEDCEYLRSLGFNSDFVNYLSDFRIRADIFSVEEGELAFPQEPLLRVEGNLIECQLAETLILNTINFQSLIATKAARIKQAAGDRSIIDFGLRRAQGLGGIHASRAAIIGGADSTSNVLAAYQYGLKATGTQAHSWIQSYENELDAFRDFTRAFPEQCILLVDTYNTLKKGVPHAIQVAKEMEQQGMKLYGIRLDSGDLAYLSKKARKALDDAGLPYVKITASNQLDEHVIKSLLDQGAPIDAFGVGTNLATGGADSALDGVYKLSMSNGKPRLKISENKEKIIQPGVKETVRFIDDHNMFYGDGIGLVGEKNYDTIYHPNDPDKRSDVTRFTRQFLQKQVMDKGKNIAEKKNPYELAAYARERLNQLPPEHKRFANPHVYKVGVSENLLHLRKNLIKKINAQI